jgi:hypothetical protein
MTLKRMTIAAVALAVLSFTLPEKMPPVLHAILRTLTAPTIG